MEDPTTCYYAKYNNPPVTCSAGELTLAMLWVYYGLRHNDPLGIQRRSHRE
jgi:hypothetical protein